MMDKGGALACRARIPHLLGPSPHPAAIFHFSWFSHILIPTNSVAP